MILCDVDGCEGIFPQEVAEECLPAVVFKKIYNYTQVQTSSDSEKEILRNHSNFQKKPPPPFLVLHSGASEHTFPVF
jgi:hypothetical protein